MATVPTVLAKLYSCITLRRRIVSSAYRNTCMHQDGTLATLFLVKDGRKPNLDLGQKDLSTNR